MGHRHLVLGLEPGDLARRDHHQPSTDRQRQPVERAAGGRVGRGLGSVHEGTEPGDGGLPRRRRAEPVERLPEPRRAYPQAILATAEQGQA